jgi:hypothetical protein
MTNGIFLLDVLIIKLLPVGNQMGCKFIGNIFLCKILGIKSLLCFIAFLLTIIFSMVALLMRGG